MSLLSSGHLVPEDGGEMLLSHRHRTEPCAFEGALWTIVFCVGTRGVHTAAIPPNFPRLPKPATISPAVRSRPAQEGSAGLTCCHCPAARPTGQLRPL